MTKKPVKLSIVETAKTVDILSGNSSYVVENTPEKIDEFIQNSIDAFDSSELDIRIRDTHCIVRFDQIMPIITARSIMAKGKPTTTSTNVHITLIEYNGDCEFTLDNIGKEIVQQGTITELVVNNMFKLDTNVNSLISYEDIIKDNKVTPLTKLHIVEYAIIPSSLIIMYKK